MKILFECSNPLTNYMLLQHFKYGEKLLLERYVRIVKILDEKSDVASNYYMSDLGKVVLVARGCGVVQNLFTITSADKNCFFFIL